VPEPAVSRPHSISSSARVNSYRDFVFMLVSVDLIIAINL
jgi:hypothetical protein